MGRILALCLACVTSTGCALLANANAHHNSQGTACLDEPVFGVIDLVIAGVGAAAIGATETSPGWYAVPGVFAASGLLGVISAHRCKGESAGVAEAAPPASNSAPPLGDAPVDPEAREATREEMGLAPVSETPQPTLQLDRHGVPRTLPPPTTPPPPTVTRPPPEKPKVTQPTCTLEPRKECPDGYYCQLVEENTGVCEKM